MELWERTELRGTTLGGQYRIGSCIGVGGTAVVFEAKRVFDDSRVIIKTLRPTFVHETDIVNRLCREADVAAALRHPGIVPVVDQGVLPDGSPYLVMKRVDGESLASLVRRCGSLNVAETSVIAIRVASILHAIHAEGVVHRDLKPEHVVLDRGLSGNLRVFLLDFGVCASSKVSPEEQESEKGRVFGTPSYVSPEQAIGNPHVDGRADLFLCRSDDRGAERDGRQ